MANSNPTPILLTISISISILLSSVSCRRVADAADDVVLLPQNTNTTREKFSHFRLFWHDIQSGSSPTSVPVVKSPTGNGFGQVNMIDNPLTLGPELGSRVVGRAQGFYAMASQEELGLLMTMNFVFTYGKYSGSTITVVGRNEVMDRVREMPVVGGSGLFRFARGYVQARTHDFNLRNGDATVEYSVYVLHY